ncbi:MAG: hypothetical protein HY645_07940 [Acidobacteria bacterium]|nr:hypothetical protein [Acidobacteriota bacterium]
MKEWEAEKERFAGNLSWYQEVLNELYFHVLARVDEYNTLVQEAHHMYVGVKGIFNVGSPLVPSSMKRLPLKKYVPAQWYDTIFYDGYYLGYNEGYERARPPRP